MTPRTMRRIASEMLAVAALLPALTLAFGSPASASTAALASDVQLETAKSTVTFGDKTTLSVTVDPFTPGATVDLYNATHAPKVWLANAPLDGGGHATFTVKPSSRTVYRAVLAHDPTYGGAFDTLTVEVRPIFHARWLHRDGVQGMYALYEYDPRCPTVGDGCPTQSVELEPLRPEATLTYRVQSLVRGEWRKAGTGHVELNEHGVRVLRWTYQDQSVIGRGYRVRYVFPGSKGLLRARSHWTYFKVVRAVA